MSNEKVIIELELDSSDPSKKLNKLTNEFKDAGNKAGGEFGSSFTSSLSNIAKGVGGLLAGFFIGSGIKNAFTAITDAAKEQEAAVKSLSIALSRTGDQLRVSEFEEMADSLQKIASVGDDVIIKQAALAINLGATADQAKKIIPVAIDMAEALGISVDTAVQNLTLTLAGNVRSIGLLIPETKELTSRQLELGGAIDIVEQKFKGTAESTDDYAKKTSQLSNSWGELLESMGMYLTQSPTINYWIKATTDLFYGLASSMGSSEGAEQKVVELNKSINDLKSSLKDDSGGGFQIYNKMLQDEITRLEEQRNSLIAQMPQGAQVGPETPAEFQKKQNEELRKIYQERSIDTIAALNDLGIQTDQQQFDESVRKQEALLLAYDRDLLSFEEFQRRKTEIEQQYVDSRYKLAVDGEEKKNKKVIKAQFDANQVMGNIVASGIQTFARNIIEGQNVAKEFGKFLLNAFGDFATQLGAFFVATGIANAAMFTLDPTGTIAAGIGLIALGQIMKSFAGGGLGGSSAASSPAIGPSYEVTTPDQTEIDNEEIERVSPRSSIVINVDGDIVSEDAFGSRLVDLINKSIDNTDVKLRFA